MFVRIFVLFWVAMSLIIGASIAATVTIASRLYESPDLQRRPIATIEAGEVLDRGGLPALKTWLQKNNNSYGDRDVFIVDADEHDILGRKLPELARRRLEYFNREIPPLGNARPSRFSPQILAPDGHLYMVLFTPRRPSIFGALSLPAISLTIVAIALVVSAVTSWWLAGHLTAPIRRIQAGARSLASHNLDVRVSAGLEDRHDELAVLARDFDAMADQLRANRAATNQLLRDISHELRSPLARMRVALGLARQAPADLTRQHDRLEREIERLDALISQVLKLARLQGSDLLPLQRERFELNEVIEDLVHDANFEGAVKQCTVQVQGDTSAAILGNRELLRSALENVLRNAVRYSPPQQRVEVRVSKAGQGLEVVVSDHGPGVPPADLERIFEPFYRVAESRDRDSGGEGIGLAITSRVMRAHGGTARAQNRPGGFEVHLNLPAAALTA